MVIVARIVSCSMLTSGAWLSSGCSLDTRRPEASIAESEPGVVPGSKAPAEVDAGSGLGTMNASSDEPLEAAGQSPNAGDGGGGIGSAPESVTGSPVDAGTRPTPAVFIIPTSSFDVLLGAERLQSACPSWSTGGNVPGVGPNFDTRSNAGNYGCAFPYDLRFNLQIHFAGFLPSEGIPAGETDLSGLTAAATVRVGVIVDYPVPEAPVGTPVMARSVEYKSFIQIYQDTGDRFEIAPGVSGTVTVTPPTSSNLSQGESGWYRIDASGVTLPIVADTVDPTTEAGLPTTVTISGARLFYR